MTIYLIIIFIPSFKLIGIPQNIPELVFRVQFFALPALKIPAEFHSQEKHTQDQARSRTPVQLSRTPNNMSLVCKLDTQRVRT